MGHLQSFQYFRLPSEVQLPDPANLRLHFGHTYLRKLINRENQVRLICGLRLLLPHLLFLTEQHRHMKVVPDLNRQRSLRRAAIPLQGAFSRLLILESKCLHADNLHLENRHPS